MIKTAYVHIGLHKTGTTSIQRAFARHRHRLLEQHGLIYPSVATNHSGPLHSMFCRDPENYVWNLTQGASGVDQVSEQNRAFADSLSRDLARPGESLVISGEDLARLGGRAVAHFKRWLEPHVEHIRVLAYVREPVAWATSHAQQQVRKGRVLEELLALNLAPRLRKRLEPWLAAFGDAMTVFDFDVARQHEAGLVAQFAEQVGLPPATYAPMLSVHANQSFSAEAVALLSALNRITPRSETGRPVAQRAPEIERAFAKLNGERFCLPPESAASIASAAVPDLAWLAETFGIRFAPPLEHPQPAPMFGSAAARESLARLISALATGAD